MFVNAILNPMTMCSKVMLIEFCIFLHSQEVTSIGIRQYTTHARLSHHRLQREEGEAKDLQMLITIGCLIVRLIATT